MEDCRKNLGWIFKDFEEKTSCWIDVAGGLELLTLDGGNYPNRQFRLLKNYFLINETKEIVTLKNPKEPIETKTKSLVTCRILQLPILQTINFGKNNTSKLARAS